MENSLIMSEKLYTQLRDQFLSNCVKRNGFILNSKKNILQEKSSFLTEIIERLKHSQKEANSKKKPLSSIEKEFLKELFDNHKNFLMKAITFISELEKKDTFPILEFLPSEDQSNTLTIRIHYDQETIEKEFIISESPKEQILKYMPLFVRFLSFVYQQTLSKHLAKLEKKVEKLEKKVEKLEEKNSFSPSIHKVPVNLFNVMLTDKPATLDKLQKKITEISNKIPKAKDEKRLSQLQKQLQYANELHEKASKNFPDDFYFTVYEHYAIYGGIILLSKNNFKPVEMTFTGVLEALNFEKIGKKDITEIKKAFKKLTTQRFPSYFIRVDPKDSNKYIFWEGDEPIFQIGTLGSLDLNINLSDPNIIKKKLILSLRNHSLREDLEHFYSMINSNLLAELRKYKRQPSEDDLYFITFLLREMRFHQKTIISLDEICTKIKKDGWLLKNEKPDKERKRLIKNKTSNLLDFAKQQNLVSEYKIEKDQVTIHYKLPKKNPRLISKKS